MKIIKAQTKPITGEMKIPGDKSISHRAAMFAGLTEKPVEIRNYLMAGDCLSTLNCLEALGAKIIRSGDDVLISGGLHKPTKILDAGNSGTTVRLMTGLLAGLKIPATFTGDSSLSKRPMNRIIKPLELMGAKISAVDGRLPLTIELSGELRGITYQMPVASAQVKSAVLLAGLNAATPTTVIEPAFSRNHTEQLLKVFGAEILTQGREIKIFPTKRLSPPEVVNVPSDFSSAAFWIVAATCLDGSDLLIKNVGINPTRTALLEVLLKMGAKIDILNRRGTFEPTADLRVKFSRLNGCDIGAEIIPNLIDEIPILAVAAAFANSTSTIRDAGELRVKESDRLAAIISEFNKVMPNSFRADGDNLIITPLSQTNFAECKTFGDHRLAMALAVFGLLGDGVALDDVNCVNISYPNFWGFVDKNS